MIQKKLPPSPSVRSGSGRSPKGRSRKSTNPYFTDIILFLLLSGLVILVLGRGNEQLGYHWQWYRVPKYLYRITDGRFVPGPLLSGLLTTLRICGWSTMLAAVFGLTTALFRLSDSPVARGVARIYLETIRNTPLLVQIFFLYFVLAPILDMGRFFTAVLALSLFEGAYVSEIFRAGIVSIDDGQWQAARSLGLNTLQTYIRVILPQAVRRILPPLTSQAVSLIKDSALVSTIAVYDLTMQGRAVIAETFLTFEIWFTVAAIYLCITLTLSGLVHLLEKHLQIRRTP